MTSLFKKLNTFFKSVGDFFKIKNPKLQPTLDYTYDMELVAALEEVVQYPDLDKLLKNPVSKIYIINTYSTTYNDLGSMLVDKRYNRKIIAVNLHSYFNGEEGLVGLGLKRVISFLKGNKCTAEAIHDLYEISRTIKHLIELRSKS